jgi:thiosulfate dehydrogenase [quinone] large subunit
LPFVEFQFWIAKKRIVTKDKTLAIYAHFVSLFGAAYMDKQMHNAPLPGFLVHFVAVVLPWCEGTVGLLMILGLWTSLALIAGSLLMLTLQIGTCLAQNWDVAGGQLIYVLLFFILLTYCERNRWSVDRWWERIDDKNEE